MVSFCLKFVCLEQFCFCSLEPILEARIFMLFHSKPYITRDSNVFHLQTEMHCCLGDEQADWEQWWDEINLRFNNLTGPLAPHSHPGLGKWFLVVSNGL